MKYSIKRHFRVKTRKHSNYSKKSKPYNLRKFRKSIKKYKKGGLFQFFGWSSTTKLYTDE